MDIGKRVVYFRELKGISGAGLAERIGLDQSQISKIETNKSHPSLRTLMKMCDVFNISLGKFFEDEVEVLPQEINRLLIHAKSMSPSQLKALEGFLATLNAGGKAPRQPQKVQEKPAAYNPALDRLAPLKEKDLGEAILKIRQISEEHGLTRDEEFHLIEKARDHYGMPVIPAGGGEAAHGPGSPGQIPSQTKKQSK